MCNLGVGPDGTPIPIPNPQGDDDGFKTPSSKKRKRATDVSSDSERTVKTTRSEEAIQVEMPAMPPLPNFGLPELNITQIPLGEIPINPNDTALSDVGFLPFIAHLPDPTSVIGAGDGSQSAPQDAVAST